MRRLTFLPVAALVAACGNTTADLETLRDTMAQGSEFDQRLAADYRDFADFEATQMFDWRDQAYFAGKGLRAADGQEVLPDLVSSRKLTAEQALEAEASRDLLMAAFSEGGRAASPAAAARAQTNFDCWLEQLEEGWQFDHIASCRDGFEQALAKVKADLAPQPVATVPETEATPLPLPVRSLLVFFDFDSAALDDSARQVLEQAAEIFRGNDATSLRLAGHADRAGPGAYNMDLSERRAEAVKNSLAQLGLDTTDVTMQALGEQEPLVPTNDGVPEPQNRRVELRFEPSTVPVASGS